MKVALACLFVTSYAVSMMTLAIFGPYGFYYPFYWLGARYYFKKYNRVCFNNKLKKIPIKIYPSYIFCYPDHQHVTMGVFSFKGNKAIEIGVSCMSPNWKGTLLHEMCHYFQFQGHVETKTMYVYDRMGINQHTAYFESLLNQAKLEAGIK